MIGTAYFKDGHTEEILMYDNGHDGIRTYFETESGWYKRHLTSNPEANGEYIYSKFTPLKRTACAHGIWCVVHDIERIELKESENGHQKTNIS